jgi:hypothetical protein
MSEHPLAPPESPDAPPHAEFGPEPPTLTTMFEPAEIKTFDEEDVEAGKNICKMLSLFFFYTVIVMGLSTYITLRWVM